jgi:hypothetical protein
MLCYWGVEARGAGEEGGSVVSYDQSRPTSLGYEVSCFRNLFVSS